MKKLAIFLAFSLGFSLSVLGQEKSLPTKLAEDEIKTGFSRAFLGQIDKAARDIAESHQDAKIYIALDWKRNSFEDMLRFRRDQAKKFSSLGLKTNQYEITHPQVSYRPEMFRNEVWLVPPGADNPYKSFHASCESNFNPSIIGMPDIDPKMERVFYYMKPIWWPDEFKTIRWTVEGGTIVEGAGTDKIIVRPTNSKSEVITVRLEVKLIDQICPVLDDAVIFETKFRK